MKQTSRRGFIMQAGIAAAGMSVMPSILQAHTPLYTGKKLNVALVGLGRYAALLAESFQASQYCKLQAW